MSYERIVVAVCDYLLIYIHLSYTFVLQCRWHAHKSSRWSDKDLTTRDMWLYYSFVCCFYILYLYQISIISTIFVYTYMFIVCSIFVYYFCSMLLLSLFEIYFPTSRDMKSRRWTYSLLNSEMRGVASRGGGSHHQVVQLCILVR